MKNALLIYCAVLLLGCNACPRKPLIAKDTTYENERNNTLFVFVGEKIEVKSQPVERGAMDAGVKARYKILQRVYGNYDKDEIEFFAYDHYGRFGFANYRHVLLFVSEYKGKYYHEKYQYNDVYRTKNGRWAGSYATGDYEHSYNDSTTVKPEKIDFIEPVSYPVKTVLVDGTVYDHYYPEPYLKIEGDKAIAVYGNYIEELFRLKKEGVLTARELFGPKRPEPEIQLEPIRAEPDTVTAEELKFIKFWKKTFVPIIKTGSLQQFKNWSLDSIVICDSIRSIEGFNKECFQTIFNKDFITGLKDRKKDWYSSFGPVKEDATDTLSSTRHTIIKKVNSYLIYEVVIKTIGPKKAVPFDLQFVETKKGYALIAIRNAYGKKCCR